MNELESVFKSQLAIREVGRVRVQGSEVKVHSSRIILCTCVFCTG